MYLNVRLNPFIKLARPHQYLKNAFVFLPLFFGYKFSGSSALVNTIWAFVGFSLAASCVYVINDLKDIKEDLAHPKKKSRPLPKGEVTKSEAIFFSLGLGAGAVLVGTALLPRTFLAVLLAYLAINLGYSFGLKHKAIVDVVAVATGFVLRVFAGGVAAAIWPSHWLVLMTFLLALFLALAKRRDDLLLAAYSNNLRRSLDGYSLEFVSNSMMVMAAVTIVSYILYTLSPEVAAKHGTKNLYLTTFWVIIGLMRYLQITFVFEKSGSPTEVLLKDLFLQAVIVLWLFTFFMIIHVSCL